MLIVFNQAIDLHIDESSFTGETEPAMKCVNIIEKTTGDQQASRDTIAFMGTLVRCGNGKVRDLYIESTFQISAKKF